MTQVAGQAPECLDDVETRRSFLMWLATDADCLKDLGGSHLPDVPDPMALAIKAIALELCYVGVRQHRIMEGMIADSSATHNPTKGESR